MATSAASQPAHDCQHDNQHAQPQRNPPDPLDDPLAYRGDQHGAYGGQAYSRQQAAAGAASTEPYSPAGSPLPPVVARRSVGRRGLGDPSFFDQLLQVGAHVPSRRGSADCRQGRGDTPQLRFPPTDPAPSSRAVSTCSSRSLRCRAYHAMRAAPSWMIWPWPGQRMSGFRRARVSSDSMYCLRFRTLDDELPRMVSPLNTAPSAGR